MNQTKVIQSASLNFLKKLSKNNNRDWFNDNKENYLAAKLNVEEFVDELISKMIRHDQIETLSGKKCLYRIYNDVRFSKNKHPYKPRFAGYLRRTKPYLRGGYYFWIGPGISRVGCGFVYPNGDDLKRIREDIDRNYSEWTKLLKTKSIQSTFGSMKGDQVRTSPKGYRSDHPAIDLLRFKQFWFERSFSDKEVLSAGFLSNVNTTFKNIRPFFDYMSEVLTTDSNGESLI